MEKRYIQNIEGSGQESTLFNARNKLHEFAAKQYPKTGWNEESEQEETIGTQEYRHKLAEVFEDFKTAMVNDLIDEGDQISDTRLQNFLEKYEALKKLLP